MKDEENKLYTQKEHKEEEDDVLDSMMSELSHIQIPFHTENDDDENNEGTSLCSYSSNNSDIEKRKVLSNLDAGWDDLVIIRTFQLAIESHDNGDRGRSGGVRVPHSEKNDLDDEEIIKSDTGEKIQSSDTEKNQDKGEKDEYEEERWRPGDLPLPHWAIDPWYAMRHQKQTTLTTQKNKKREKEYDEDNDIYSLIESKKRVAVNIIHKQQENDKSVL